MTSAPVAPGIAPPAPASTTAAAAKAPWTVDVDVILLDMNTNPPTFEIQSYLQNPPNGPLDFRNNHRPGFNIRFNLHDPNGTEYRFPKNGDRNQAVWSQRGSVDNCPNAECWEVFDPLSVDMPDRMTLVVFNSNVAPNVGPFGYTLRVTNDEEWRHLDPGGNNQNGPVV